MKRPVRKMLTGQDGESAAGRSASMVYFAEKMHCKDLRGEDPARVAAYVADCRLFYSGGVRAQSRALHSSVVCSFPEHANDPRHTPSSIAVQCQKVYCIRRVV